MDKKTDLSNSLNLRDNDVLAKASREILETLAKHNVQHGEVEKIFEDIKEGMSRQIITLASIPGFQQI